MAILQEEWEGLREKGAGKKLYESMPKRVREVLSTKGMPTKY